MAFRALMILFITSTLFTLTTSTLYLPATGPATTLPPNIPL
jgi:hypothetical protein